MTKARPHSLATLSLLLAAAFPLSAATPPGISEVLQQTTPPAPPATQAPAPSLDGVLPVEPPLETLPDSRTVVAVKGFSFRGNAEIDSGQLQAAVADAGGKDLSVAELQDVAYRVTRLYRNAGYFVARAYVPAQEIVGGMVAIRVIEGHYGDLVLDNHARLNQATAQAVLDAMKDRNTVAMSTLERAVLVLDETPGVHVTQVAMTPGQRPETSDLHVTTEATPTLTGVVALDNYGSIYTGKNRLSFSGAWDAPTQAGDRLDVFAMTTEHGGLDSGRLGYWRLLTPSGWRGELAVSRTTYSLGGTYASLDAIGHATTGEAALTYPLVLTRTRRLTGQLTAGDSDLVDEVRSTGTRTPKRLPVVGGGLEYVGIAAGATTQAGATLTLGRLTFRDSVARSGDRAGADTQGAFSKLGLHLERHQELPAGFDMDMRVRAQTTLNDKSLDGSQKLEVSGSDGVMVYAPGELLGDRAALGHVTLAHPFDAGGGVQLTPGLFADEGWVRNNYAAAGATSSRTLGDAGIALVSTFRSISLDLQWAVRTQGGPAVAEPTSKSRVLAQVIAPF